MHPDLSPHPLPVWKSWREVVRPDAQLRVMLGLSLGGVVFALGGGLRDGTKLPKETLATTTS